MTTKEDLILALEINDKIIKSSTILDSETKNSFKNYSKEIRKLLEKEPKINSYGVNSIKSELLTYWNESINSDTEKFWKELKRNGINYERKEPLKFVLEKNRFRNVHQAMEARSNWEYIRRMSEILGRYTKAEIEKIESVISEDEKARVSVLKKCLKNKKIPQTQYLKLGDCMAYMGNCELWDKHFNKLEVDELFQMFNNFEPK